MTHRIEYQPLDSVLEANRNPKGHDDSGLEASVRRFGFVEPIVSDERTGRLVSGHGRLHELRRAHAAGEVPPTGVETDGATWLVPIVRDAFTSTDDAEAEAYVVAANQLTINGGWDEADLASMMTDWDDGDLSLLGTGWNSDELAALHDRLNAQPPADPWTDRKLRPMPDPGSFEGGQVWDVGPHRLIVGDARDPAAWALLPTAQLMVTDPPYGIGYDGGGGAAREVIDGDLDSEQAAALLDTVLGLAVEKLAGGGASYIFLPPGEALPSLLTVVDRHQLHRWGLVWAKDQATFGRADYHHQHEIISYGWTAGPRLVPVADRKLTTLWSYPRPRVSGDHPTAKPVGLLAKAVDASSLEGMVVLDPFAGSGSTLVAAAQAGRIGVGIELRPEYARVAVDRLAEASGETPVQVK